MSSRQPCSTVFVGNIFYEVTEDMLVKMLSEVGPVKGFRMVYDRETGKPKGYGFCEFYDVPTAESAVRNLNGRDLHGRTLRVDFADEGTKGDDKSQNQQAPAATPGMSGLTTGGDEVSNVLSSMSKNQLWDFLTQMKTLIQQNPQQARQLLVNNPSLTKAVFQTQIILGLIQTPQNQNVNNMKANPMMPMPTPMQAGAQGQAPFPIMIGAPMGMNGAAVQPMGVQGMQPYAMNQYGGMQMQPQAMAMAPNMGMDQQNQQAALLQQLLSLTPDQINMLPPDQKQQVLAVHAQMRQSG